MLKTALAILGVVWIVGRISRRSPNHPANAIPPLVATLQISSQPAPINGTWQDTAQIPGGMIAGEGGGE